LAHAALGQTQHRIELPTAEGAPFARGQLDAMLGLAERGIARLIERQRQALDE